MFDAHDSLPVLNFKASLKRSAKATILTGAVAAVLTLFLPNYYKSEARLLPVDSSMAGGLGNLAAAAAAFGVNVAGDRNSDANFVDILKSRWIRENLLKSEFRFHARNWRYGADRVRQETLYVYIGASNIDRGIEKLNRILFVNKDIKTNLITIVAETKSPELSRMIVQRVIDLLNQFVVQNSRTRGSERAIFAAARLADARKEMGKAEDLFRAFLEANRNYHQSADPGIRLKGENLEAELSLHRQLVSMLSANREQSLLDAKNDIPIVNVLDPGNLPVEKSRPSRSTIILMVSFVTGFATFLWWEREWIRSHFVDSRD